jgi:hypothetical protein
MYQLELDGAGVVDRRMTTLEIVEAVDVLADRDGRGCPALHGVDSFQLALERREETLGDGTIPAVSFPARAAFDASGVQGLSVVAARIGAATIGVMYESAMGRRLVSAVSRAASARWRSTFWLVAQPTTRLENRSRITAKYSHPCAVQRNVMSLTPT